MNLTTLLIILIALAGVLFFGGVATIAWHAILDWREGRSWPRKVEWDDDATEIRAAFFDTEPEQQPVDPWNGAESWSVDHGFNAGDQLDVIRMFARAGYDEIPKPAPLVEDEALPAFLFDDLTAQYRQVNPHLAGHTTSWVMLSAEDDQAIRDPYTPWNGFTVPLELEPARVPAARKPAGGS